MIARLDGTLVDIRTEEVVVDVSGVGYLVAVPQDALSQATLGDNAIYWISTVVREDAFLLYGFREPRQREAFDLLRSVSRIGPKHALAVLSTLSVNALAAAIASEDTAALARAPGVGKRSAQRICLELKSKLPATFSVAGTGSAKEVRPAPNDPLPLALARLGYRKSEIDRAMAHDTVPALDAASTGDRLSAALRVLAQG